MGKSKLGKLLFLMCTVDVIDYKYNIYNNKYIYIIYIIYIYLLLTWKHGYGYMNFAQFAFAQFAHVVTLLDDC